MISQVISQVSSVFCDGELNVFQFRTAGPTKKKARPINLVFRKIILDFNPDLRPSSGLIFQILDSLSWTLDLVFQALDSVFHPVKQVV